MTPECNYDSLVSESNALYQLLFGDCGARCIGNGCTIELLSNDDCDPECDKYECGYDLGKCSYCNDGCKYEMLGDGKIDLACDVPSCRYDLNDSGWCSSGCKYEML